MYPRDLSRTRVVPEVCGGPIPARVVAPGAGWVRISCTKSACFGRLSRGGAYRSRGATSTNAQCNFSFMLSDMLCINILMYKNEMIIINKFEIRLYGWTVNCFVYLNPCSLTVIM